MSRHLGIIGYPIGHSMSPVMFRAALSECGLDITYDAWEVAPEKLDKFLAKVRNSEGEILGFNATVPHKEAVYGGHGRRIGGGAEGGRGQHGGQR